MVSLKSLIFSLVFSIMVATMMIDTTYYRPKNVNYNLGNFRKTYGFLELTTNKFTFPHSIILHCLRIGID